MKLAWITGRFLLVLLVAVVGFSSAGCESPLSVLKMILAGKTGTLASTFIGNAFVAAEQENSASAEEETETTPPKAEDLLNNWEQPEFALFVTGRQHGYIEPCGCTGLENQKGGLMRRHSAQKVLLNRGWDLVSIDAGNQVRRFGQQPTIKLQKTYQSLCRIMNYSVIGIGPDDLTIPSIDMAQAVLDAPEANSPFTCANVVIEDESLTNRFQVIQRNGRKIGVTMVLGDEHVPKLQTVEGLQVETMAQGLARVVPQLQAANCDLNVLIAHASLEDCRALAKQFPIFELLVTAGGSGDPTLQPEVIQGTNHSTSMIQVGVKGMYVGVVGFYAEAQGNSIKYERVPLDDRFEDSPVMKKMFTSYQMELKGLWQAGDLEDIRPRLHPSGNKFVGSQACADCHDEEFEIWAEGVDGDGGAHEKATRDLTHPGQRAWVQRHFDPECVSCHMTGWNPQLCYPYETGYQNLERDQLLHGNGCENCHGPGSAHVAAENGETDDDDDAIERLRQQMVVTLDQARESMCMKCHDLDNSPDFVKEGGFDEYWPRIKHGGKH